MMFNMNGIRLFYGDKEIDAGYLGSQQFYGEDPLPWVLATDADFSGTRDGEFQYIGNAPYVEIPHVIKGVNVTSYMNMFQGALVLGVKSTNRNITSMNLMFNTLKSRTLDLSQLYTGSVIDMVNMFRNSSVVDLDISTFDTSSVTVMQYMFDNSNVIDLDVRSFDTSSVTRMTRMFRGVPSPILDLSSFDMSKVSDTGFMFWEAKARVGYARTQADADRMNASSLKPSYLTFVVKEEN